MAEEMRLDRYLAEMKQGTRSQTGALIRQGRVLVDGAVCREAKKKIRPGVTRVSLDGTEIAWARWEYFMLNKPQGVVSATSDAHAVTVTQLIGGALRKDLFPVGRLDIDTEGLLLLTNDGALAHALLSPRRHVDKVYFARVAGALHEGIGRRFEEGMSLPDGTRLLPASLQILRRSAQENEPICEALVTIREGKFHQIKRMFEAGGGRVVYLKRLSMGPLTLDETLEPGEYRPLTEEEIRLLKEHTK